MTLNQVDYKGWGYAGFVMGEEILERSSDLPVVRGMNLLPGQSGSQSLEYDSKGEAYYVLGIGHYWAGMERHLYQVEEMGLLG